MKAPERFAAYLKAVPYHSRSNKHSNALLELLLDDLLQSCPRFKQHAFEGTVVYELNRSIRVGTSNWNVDLAVGPPSASLDAPAGNARIVRAQPSTFRLACEAKSLMTEHHKAQRNRLRDLDALHQYMHRYDQNTIVAGVIVINISDSFRSQLRPEVTKHREPKKLVQTAVDLFRTLPLRSHPSNGPGLEANAVIVVNYDNSGSKTISELYTDSPAPQPGDPFALGEFYPKDLRSLRSEVVEELIMGRRRGAGCGGRWCR